MGAQCQALRQHALRHLRHQREGREKQHDIDQLLEKRGVHPLHKPGADAQCDGNGDEPDDDVRQAGDRVGTARHMAEGRQAHGKCAAAKLHDAEHIFIAVTVARVDNGQRTAAAKRAGDKPGADEQQLVPWALLKGVTFFATRGFHQSLHSGGSDEHAEDRF